MVTYNILLNKLYFKYYKNKSDWQFSKVHEHNPETG
jgi:hypothetical protein